jgi:serralysin
MPRRTLRASVGVLAAAALTALTASTATSADIVPTGGAYGPPYEYTTALINNNPLNAEPLPKTAWITKTVHGYLYRAGGQDSHLTLTKVTGGLRFRDTRTAKLKPLPGSCKRRTVKVGIAVVCRIPAGVSVSEPLLVEVWPRVGDDFVDGSTLPASIDMSVLADTGNDVAYLGAGDDFFNGHTGRDRVRGGAGNDWIRVGDDADTVRAGSGDDRIVGMDGGDTIYGGDGADRTEGMDGNDFLYGGSGADFLLCSTGADTAYADQTDSLRVCETVNRN